MHTQRSAFSAATVRAGVIATAMIMPGGAARAAETVARSELVASGFYTPVSIASAPGDPDHIYVSQLDGIIRVINIHTRTVLPTPLIDLSPVIGRSGDGGMLGIAFDPQFETTRHVYVAYNGKPSPPEDRVIARLTIPLGTRVADHSTLTEIWRFPRTVGHNGGWLGFSPLDGFLYLSTGDGGTGFTFDAPNRAQTIVNERMGKLLRIDIRGDDFPLDPSRNYRVLPSNPFVGLTGDDEIWSLGLRNPWQCSFDRQTGDLYIADVGQDAFEELNIAPAGNAGGQNYGWRCMEAASCTGLDGGPGCICTGGTLTLPAWSYDHAQGNSITGGYVYRGSAIPELAGRYICADFGSNRYWAISAVNGQVQSVIERTADLRPPNLAPSAWPLISAFGESATGELFYAEVGSGRVYAIVPPPCPPAIDEQPIPASVTSGGQLTLRARGAAKAPLTIRWQFNAADLDSSPRILGATTEELTILDARASDAGSYRALFTNACGTTFSESVEVTVVLCVADFDMSGARTIDDIFVYINAWFARDPRCDVDGIAGLTLDDLFVFLNRWFVGCP